MLPYKQPDPQPDHPGYTEEELAILDKAARKVVQWKMTVPAIMTLESVKPLNFIGSQAMVFFEPIVQSVFSIKDYETFRTMLERRETLELLLLRIEAFDAVAFRKERLFKKLQKDYLRQQSWFYRFKSAIIGFRVPPHLEAEWKAKLDAIDAAEAAASAKPTEGSA
ncbi:MAG: hypothetical protein IT585_04250 [candidate division Zixibacteria bacterium]|nr:hypothetical protein [candidate division Zixibacteria bacterium]